MGMIVAKEQGSRSFAFTAEAEERMVEQEQACNHRWSLCFDYRTGTRGERCLRCRVWRRVG
jgi:hypothetical protein